MTVDVGGATQKSDINRQQHCALLKVSYILVLIAAVDFLRNMYDYFFNLNNRADVSDQEYRWQAQRCYEVDVFGRHCP